MAVRPPTPPRQREAVFVCFCTLGQRLLVFFFYKLRVVGGCRGRPRTPVVLVPASGSLTEWGLGLVVGGKRLRFMAREAASPRVHTEKKEGDKKSGVVPPDGPTYIAGMFFFTVAACFGSPPGPAHWPSLFLVTPVHPRCTYTVLLQPRGPRSLVYRGDDPSSPPR